MSLIDDLNAPKDFNALRQAWLKDGTPDDRQVLLVRALFNTSQTLVERVCARVKDPSLNLTQQIAAKEAALALIASMDDKPYFDNEKHLAKIMGLSWSELRNSRKERRKPDKKNTRPGEFGTETLGGLIKGWLVEYIYDPQSGEPSLAWRDPQGTVSVGSEVYIEDTKYVPKEPSSFITEGGVLFPSQLGKLRSEQELASIVALFIQRYYLLDDPNFKWILAFYVMLTWMYDAFPAIPYLLATGDAGAGKSELMQRIGHVCYRMYNASGANTASTFFRVTQMYRPTVFIDEADLADGGDMTNDIVKYLNQGAMKTGKITRMEEAFNAAGEKEFQPALFSCFGPKLIAMRRDFGDNAVASRSIVLKLMAKEPLELKSAGVPLHMNNQFRAEALAIRNDLLAWRLNRWQGEIELTDDLMDLALSSRMNQVTMAVKAIGKLAGSDEFRRQIDRVLREYAAEDRLVRSMTLQARVLEAMWAIYTEADRRKLYLHQGSDGVLSILVGDVCKVANEIMKEMNGSDDQAGDASSEDDRRKKHKELSPQKGGSIMREDLQLRMLNRTKKGFPVIWDDIKMLALGRKFGVLPDEAAIEAAKAALHSQLRQTPAEPELSPEMSDIERYAAMADALEYDDQKPEQVAMAFEYQVDLEEV